MFDEAVRNEDERIEKERSIINHIDSFLSDSMSKKISPLGNMQYNSMNNS